MIVEDLLLHNYDKRAMHRGIGSAEARKLKMGRTSVSDPARMSTRSKPLF